eukprot:scaffold84852_cov50-Phaeocystis_antarctica.AAC.5
MIDPSLTLTSSLELRLRSLSLAVMPELFRRLRDEGRPPPPPPPPPAGSAGPEAGMAACRGLSSASIDCITARSCMAGGVIVSIISPHAPARDGEWGQW